MPPHIIGLPDMALSDNGLSDMALSNATSDYQKTCGGTQD